MQSKKKMIKKRKINETIENLKCKNLDCIFID